ncbi:MAG: LysM peptidoglycan-binding domain-containing protein [Anaerolineales bacterium]|nr:LysM peptidoglycan-binding domain-containing protein [Anaerolineales bacterium]
MKKIGETVDAFLGSVVGVGLICFASFILLLASAQLNRSRLGDLLASMAGETARTARTESFAYWGRVGQEVAAGLGYGQPIIGGGGAVITPVILNTPAPTPPPGTPQPTPTARPSAYIRSSPLSEGGLLLWRGLDAAGRPLVLGVSLQNVNNQVRAALQQNSGDMLALWLQQQLDKCLPLYNRMVQANYQDVNQASEVIGAADSLILQCNPRLYEAYARKRWAMLSIWISPDPSKPPDPGRAAEYLAGLRISVGDKLEGPARMVQPEDVYEVTVQSFAEFALSSLTFKMRAAVLNQLLGEGNWRENGGPYTVPGTLFPPSSPEPVLPTEADLTPPAVSDMGAAAQGATVQGAPGTYVVKPGDTLYSIARQFGISPQALIEANRDRLVDPNLIPVGLELRLP